MLFGHAKTARHTNSSQVMKYWHGSHDWRWVSNLKEWKNLERRTKTLGSVVCVIITVIRCCCGHCYHDYYSDQWQYIPLNIGLQYKATLHSTIFTSILMYRKKHREMHKILWHFFSCDKLFSAAVVLEKMQNNWKKKKKIKKIGIHSFHSFYKGGGFTYLFSSPHFFFSSPSPNQLVGISNWNSLRTHQ